MIFNTIQKVQDNIIHLKADEQQVEDNTIIGSKRQAGGTGSLAHYLSGLRLTVVVKPFRSLLSTF